MILALLNPDLTAVEKLRPTREEVAIVYPGIIFGDLRNVAEHTLVDFPRLVLVEEIARPMIGFGDAVDQAPPEKQANGRWRQAWIVTPPDLAALKQQATSQVNRVGESKISTLELARGLAAGAPRPRTQAVLNKVDEVRARIDAATTAEGIKTILDELEAF